MEASSDAEPGGRLGSPTASRWIFWRPALGRTVTKYTQTHNLKAAGSNPAPATTESPETIEVFGGFFDSRIGSEFALSTHRQHQSISAICVFPVTSLGTGRPGARSCATRPTPADPAGNTCTATAGSDACRARPGGGFGWLHDFGFVRRGWPRSGLKTLHRARRRGRAKKRRPQGRSRESGLRACLAAVGSDRIRACQQEGALP